MPGHDPKSPHKPMTPLADLEKRIRDANERVRKELDLVNNVMKKHRR